MKMMSEEHYAWLEADVEMVNYYKGLCYLFGILFLISTTALVVVVCL